MPTKLSYKVTRRGQSVYSAGVREDSGAEREKMPGGLQHLKILSKRFCQKTSLRVLPRLVESRTVTGKLLWTSVFLGLLTGLLVVSTLLILDFLAFRTQNAVETIYDETLPFPAVTVCPNKPLNERGLAAVQPYTPRWWMSQVVRQLNQRNGTAYNPVKAKNTYYFSYLQYYQFFTNRSITEEVGQQLAEVIIGCQYTNSTKSGFAEPFVGYRCMDNTEVMKVERITVPRYFNCYTFSFVDKHTRHARSLFLPILAPDFRAFKTPAMSEEAAKKVLEEGREWDLGSETLDSYRSSGVRVLLHASDTLPDVAQSGWHLSPGMVHDVHVSAYQNINLESPYGRCEKYAAENAIEDKGRVYKYTENACKKRNVQKRMKKECLCINPEFPVSKEDEPDDDDAGKLKYCFKMNSTAPYNVDVASAECASQLSNSDENSKQDEDNCPIPCSKYTYTHKLASSKISDPVPLFTFYRKYSDMLQRVNKEYSTKQWDFTNILMTNFQTVIDLMDNGSYVEAMKQLETLRMNEQILILTINRKSGHVTRLREIPLFSLPSLLSMLGGLSSLFIGFNFFVIFEFFEFCCRSMKNIVYGNILQNSNKETKIEESKSCVVTKKDNNNRAAQVFETKNEMELK